MHTHDKLSITDPGNRPHLATFFWELLIRFFFTVERYCDFPVLLIQSLYGIIKLRFVYLAGLSNFSFLLYFLQFAQKHSEKYFSTPE